MKRLLYFISSLFVASCGGGGGSGGGGSGGSGISISTLEMAVTSDEVSTFSSFHPTVACDLSIGGSPHNGDCMTPVSMKAKIFGAHLGNSYGSPPVRIIDFTATPEGEPENGPHGVLGIADYDFAASAENTNPYSDDNIQDTTGNYFNSVTLALGAIEMKFEIPAGNGGVANKFWTVRYMLLPQNPLDDSDVDTCVTNTTMRTALTSGGDLYASPNGFQQGDILVCQKANTGDVCADNEFQWIDSADGSLSATRPTNPVRLSGTYAFQDNSCSDGGADLRMGGSWFKTTLSPAIRLNKTRAAENCLYKYVYQTNCTTTGLENGSCSDGVQDGFGVNLSVDFNLANSLFVESSLDLTSDAEATILQNMHLVLPKPLYVENNKAAVGTGDDTELAAAVTITVDDTIATTALTQRGEDPANYDSDFCFIEPQQ